MVICRIEFENKNIMQSIVLRISEIDLKDRLTVEHYICQDIKLIHKLRESVYPLIPLGQIAKVKGGKRLPANARYSITGIPYVRVVDVGDFEVDLSNVVYISGDLHNRIQRYQLKRDDIAIVIVGATIGKTAIFKSTVSPCNFNENLARITSKDNKLNPKYLLTYLKSCFGQAYISWLTGGSAQAKLSLERIEKINIPIPPRPIQDCIAQIMQDAYSVNQQKLVSGENLIVGIQDYILKKLEIPNVLPTNTNRFIIKQLQLNRFDVRYFLPFYTQLEEIIDNGIYPTKTLSEICIKIVNGLTPARDGYTENGCVVIKVASLTKTWRIEWKKVAFTSRIFFEQAKKAYIKDGDILLLSASHQLDYIGGSFGLVRDIPIEYIDKCMAVGELIIVRTNDKIVLPEYLLTCFITTHIQRLINRMSRGQTAHLYAEDLQHLRVPIPPMKIQQVIVDELNRRRNEAKRLYTEAENLLTETKARVERMILGEEDVT